MLARARLVGIAKLREDCAVAVICSGQLHENHGQNKRCHFGRVLAPLLPILCAPFGRQNFCHTFTLCTTVGTAQDYTRSHCRNSTWNMNTWALRSGATIASAIDLLRQHHCNSDLSPDTVAGRPRPARPRAWRGKPAS